MSPCECLALHMPLVLTQRLAGSRGKDLVRPREGRDSSVSGSRKLDKLSEDSRRGDPAWMIDDSEDPGDESSLLEERRQEFEAERRTMQEEREREKAARMAEEHSEAELDLINDDEIEAMRREALEEERNERRVEVRLLLPICISPCC